MTFAQANELPEAKHATEGFVEVDGYTIYFRQVGSGHPLVLAHGWGSDGHANWQTPGWVDLLVPHRRVISIDIRGHGRSDKPHALSPYGYAAMSRDVLAVMDELNIPKADFMGYSMGSFIGAHLLGHHAERFTAMILGGIGDETTESAAQGAAIGQALRAPTLAEVPEGYGRQVRQFVGMSERSDLIALAFSAEKMWPEGYPLVIAGPNIGAAKIPVLVVNGANDYPYVDTAEQLVAAMPNAKYVEIPDTDHLSVVADERFKAVVVEFITNL